MSGGIRIGVIIVSYCGRKDTLECLKSILNADDANSDIISVIIDNGSPRELVTHSDLESLLEEAEYRYSIDYTEQYYRMNDDSGHELWLIHNKYNNGFGAGNNIGISLLKRLHIDIAILLNNDTVVPSDFFENIISKYKDTTTPLALSPKSLSYYNHSVVDSAGFGYFDMKTGRSSHTKKYNCSYIVGSCIVANHIELLPFFDENFFLYYEDIDYSISLRRKGYKLLYDSNNHFYHKVNASTYLNPDIERIRIQSLKYLMRKHGSMVTNFTFKISRSIYYLLKFKVQFLMSLWK